MICKVYERGCLKKQPLFYFIVKKLYLWSCKSKIMMKYILKLSVVVIFCSYANLIYSQTLEEAKVLYVNGEYAKALPAFEIAIKKTPNNSSCNQWYGNCLLETGKLTESEKYLKFAASKNVKESFCSLGKLYFMLYRFKESEEAYENYLVFLRKEKQIKEIEIFEKLRDQSKNAARMLTNCEDIQIIDSVIVNKKGFLEKYNMLSEESGSVFELNGLSVYENQLQDKRYYAKPDDKKRYSLYSQTKLMNNWSDEMPLKLPVDTMENDNYPFVLSDGITVYYASTGSGSIGGYDLFVTRYNYGSETFFKPEQLGMPFNSPYNDYMLAVDEYNGVGYFATDRFQPEGKVVIYTFIPNDEKITIQTEDQNYLIDRAKIISIKQSQKKGIDYKSKLLQIKADHQKSREVIAREFEFVINDNTVYHKLDDFKSHAAKQSFIQYRDFLKQLASLNNQLEEKRKEYIEGNAAKKNRMSESILADEKKSEEMITQCDKMAVEIRNTENKYLRNTQ